MVTSPSAGLEMVRFLDTVKGLPGKANAVRNPTSSKHLILRFDILRTSNVPSVETTIFGNLNTTAAKSLMQ